MPSGLWRPNSRLVKPPPGSVVDWSHPISKDLVGCWLMNEGAGGIVKDIARNNDGTLTGGPTWGAGKYGSAVSFDGTNDYALVSPRAACNITRDLTVIAAINTVSAALNKTIVSKGEVGGAPSTEQYHLSFAGDTNPRIVLANGTTRIIANAGSGTAPNGQYNTIVGTYNGIDTGIIYINGNAKATTTSAGFGALNIAAYNLSFAASFAGAAGWLNGLISHVQIWSRALSAAEIAQLYYEPFCFVQVPSSRLYFFSNTAAAPASRTSDMMIMGF